MEVIISSVFISALASFYIAKYKKRLILPAYIAINILVNITFYTIGYISVGYVDPFWPIAHFNITLITLFSTIIGHLICELIFMNQSFLDDRNVTLSNKTIKNISLISPVIFVSSLIFLFVTSRFLSHDFPFALCIPESLIIYAQYGWIVISTRFLIGHKQLQSVINYKNIILCYFGIILVPLLFNIGYNFGILNLYEYKSVLNMSLISILLATFIYCAFYLLSNSVKSLLIAESDNFDQNSKVLITMAQYFLLPIFIFWLHKRLQKII